MVAPPPPPDSSTSVLTGVRSWTKLIANPSPPVELQSKLYVNFQWLGASNICESLSPVPCRFTNTLAPEDVEGDGADDGAFEGEGFGAGGGVVACAGGVVENPEVALTSPVGTGSSPTLPAKNPTSPTSSKPATIIAAFLSE